MKTNGYNPSDFSKFLFVMPENFGMGISSSLFSAIQKNIRITFKKKKHVFFSEIRIRWGNL
jgi:hypothetical protein